jgi:hypothetical protein
MENKPEIYWCFYPKTDFWVMEIEDIKDWDYYLPEEYSEELFKKIKTYENEYLTLDIYKDGLLMILFHQKINKNIYRKNLLTEKNIEETDESVATRLIYLNAINLLLHSASLKSSQSFPIDLGELYPGLVFWATMEDGKLYNFSSPQNVLDIMNPFRFRHKFHSSATESTSERKNSEALSSLGFRKPIPVSVFDQLFEDLNMVIGDFNTIQTLDTFSFALVEYSKLHFSTSLIQLWFIIEYLLNHLWVEFLKEKQNEIAGAKRISGKRRDFLTGRDFTASIISNILELCDILDKEVFDKIEQIRSKRNKIVHSLEKVNNLADKIKENPKAKEIHFISANDCSLAFSVAEYLIEKIYSVELRYQLGYRRI